MAKNPYIKRDEISKRLAEIDTKIQGCNHAIDCNNKALNKLMNKRTTVQAELDALSNEQPIAVSDHALVRFMERELHMDLDVVRAQLISPELQQVVNEKGGTGKYAVNGARVVMKDYTVVTYLSNWKPEDPNQEQEEHELQA